MRTKDDVFYIIYAVCAMDCSTSHIHIHMPVNGKPRSISDDEQRRMYWKSTIYFLKERNHGLNISM